jgi:hypothetical protein
MFRVVIPVDSMDSTSWQLAAAYALKMAPEASPRATDVVLLTHTKHQLDHTSLAGHLGPGASKALSKGTTLNLDGGVTLRHATLRTLGYSTRNSIVIAFYADEGMLGRVDELDEAFRILRAKGHALDPAAIKSWAIRQGWKPGGADELSKVAAKIAKLKNKPSLGALHDPHGRYERWKG